MDSDVYGDIVACLPKGRTIFYYEQERYAAQLAKYLLQAGMSARDIKNSRFAKLLGAPLIKAYLAQKGQLALEDWEMDYMPMANAIGWRLTLAKWSDDGDRRWRQLSRKGCNMVLQINMPRSHDEAYRRLVAPDGRQLFQSYGHPHAPREHTLAWVRLDVDFAEGEVLIEEIQSDWVRNAGPKGMCACCLRRWFWDEDEEQIPQLEDIKKGLKTYRETIYPRYARAWQETAMAAALFLIVEELGIHRIYMHEYRTGCLLKNIDPHYGPPKSIYSKLPKQFCFQLGDDTPALLADDRRRIRRKANQAKIENLKFWKLDLGALNVKQADNQAETRSCSNALAQKTSSM